MAFQSSPPPSCHFVSLLLSSSTLSLLFPPPRPFLSFLAVPARPSPPSFLPLFLWFFHSLAVSLLMPSCLLVSPSSLLVVSLFSLSILFSPALPHTFLFLSFNLPYFPFATPFSYKYWKIPEGLIKGSRMGVCFFQKMNEHLGYLGVWA